VAGQQLQFNAFLLYFGIVLALLAVPGGAIAANPIHGCEGAVEAAQNYIRSQVGDSVFTRDFSFKECTFREGSMWAFWAVVFEYCPTSGGLERLVYNIAVWPAGECFSQTLPLPKCANNPEYCIVRVSREEAVEQAGLAGLEGLASEWDAELTMNHYSDHLVWVIGTKLRTIGGSQRRKVVRVNAFTGEAVGPYTEEWDY